jgi:fermentation-respiration switch protein FrsA (DUF1100 family)
LKRFSAASLLVLTAAWLVGCGSASQSEQIKALRDENGRQARELEQLRQENAALQDRIAQQHELLRTDTLQSPRRSVDELLALFPARFPTGDWRPAETLFEDCWFTGVDGIRLHGWYLPRKDPTAVVLQIHGNAGNLTGRAQLANELQQRCGVAVMIFDYRGYGRSEGTPTIEGLLRDARAARAELAQREGIEEQGVVLMGESLGGAIAVDLAASDGARGLVLESTFSSLRDAASAHYPEFLVSTLVADKLNSAARISSYHGPLLQFHGDADQVIPLESSRRLFDAANQPKSLKIMRGHDHNDPLPEAFFRELGRFFAQLEQN